MNNSNCGYEFDPEEWENKIEESNVSSPLNDVWSCPHDAESEVEGKSLCIFHMPVGEKNDQEVADKFLEKVNEEGVKQFIGAKFGDLNLQVSSIGGDDNQTVRLDHSTIEGELDMVRARVQQSFVMRFSSIKEINAANTKFLQTCSFEETEFLEESNFSGAEFHEVANFTRSKFLDKVEFLETTFYGIAEFRGTHFRGSYFIQSTFNDKARFISASFENADFGLGHGKTEFNKTADFSSSKFSKADFRNVKFKDDARFGKCEFGEKTIFWNTQFKERLELHPRNESFIDLRGAEISGGYILQPTDYLKSNPNGFDSNAYFDLGGSTVGDVDIKANLEDDDIFSYYRFYKTDFEGFNFSGYWRELSPNWHIHKVDKEFPDRDSNLKGLVQTYLKARKGAELVGGHRSSSEFFIKEKRFRRKKLKQELKENSGKHRKWSNRQLLLENWLYDKTAVFGERPSQVAKISAIIIVSFAVIYPITGIKSGSTVLEYSLLGYLSALPDALLSSLYFSLVTFTTLGYGDIQPIGLTSQISAAIESLLGAILVALLIFTVGRKVKR